MVTCEVIFRDKAFCRLFFMADLDAATIFIDGCDLRLERIASLIQFIDLFH